MKKIDIREIANKIRKCSFKENIKWFLGMKGSSSKIALSVALGLFIGLTIPMGLQSIVIIPLSLILDCNIVLALLATLISNPVTIIPIYFIAIKIGELFTPLSIQWERISLVLSKPTFQSLFDLGKEGIILILLGTFIMGIVTSALSYIIILKAIIVYRKRNSSLLNN